MMKEFDSIIFDLDGTLWDALDTSVKTLAEVKEMHTDIIYDITPEEVTKTFGKPFSECAQMYYGYLGTEKAEEYMQEALKVNTENLLKYGAELYPKMPETIKKLAQNFKLFIVSNCMEGYIESFFENSGLAEYFCDFENHGRTGLTKGENIKLVIKRNDLKNAMYVGDTISDKNAADFAGIPFAYASYGFGEVTEFDCKLNSIEDLLEISNVQEEGGE